MARNAGVFELDRVIRDPTDRDFLAGEIEGLPGKLRRLCN
jgi:hypothetical protein